MGTVFTWADALEDRKRGIQHINEQGLREAVKSTGTIIKTVVEDMISSMQKENISHDEIQQAMLLAVQLRY